MSTPSMFGSEWDAGGWIYVAVDLAGANVIKVGWTTDPKMRGKQHRRWGLTTLVQLAADSPDDEESFHYAHRRYRRQHGDPHTRMRTELYDPHRSVIDSIFVLMDNAERRGRVKYARGWDIDSVLALLEDMHIAWMRDDDAEWA